MNTILTSIIMIACILLFYRNLYLKSRVEELERLNNSIQKDLDFFRQLSESMEQDNKPVIIKTL